MGKTLNAVGELKRRKAARIYNEFAGAHLRVAVRLLERIDLEIVREFGELEEITDGIDRAILQIRQTLTTIEEDAKKTLEEK